MLSQNDYSTDERRDASVNIVEAGRAAAERYLDLGGWVDEDEWERAKSDQEVTR